MKREDRITVIVLTYNCARWLPRTLYKLTNLPEKPPIIVVDNASTDGTGELIEKDFAGVMLIRLHKNIGAAARNIGVEYARTPYIAFSDDDTWWKEGSPAQAADLFDAHPSLGVINAKILVREEERVDPISLEMADSPLRGSSHIPGAVLLSFMAGASAVRKKAFLDAGGYDYRLFMGGEEALLGCDLAAAGWDLRYIPSIIVYHYPSGNNFVSLRKYGIRNTLWFAWRRRPLKAALGWTWFIMAKAAPKNLTTLEGFWEAMKGLPWILSERKVVPPHIEEQLRILEKQQRTSVARQYK